ncbi:MAG: helicase-associated domain-containing protein [Planctomycetota bacterium]
MKRDGHDPRRASRRAGDDGGTAKPAGGRAATPTARAPRATIGVRDLLEALRAGELRELYEFWGGPGARPLPDSPAEMRRHLARWMSDPGLIEERIGSLGRRLGAVIEDLVSAPHYQRSWPDLLGAKPLSYMSNYDLEACVAALGRRGLVTEAHDPRFESYGVRVIAVPAEVGDNLLRRRRERRRGIFAVLTLRGHLDQIYAESAPAPRIAPQRLRELYKMYGQETASVTRIERLPEGVHGLVEKAILQFGGILSRQLFTRMETDLPHWNGRRWRMILEQSLVGTVQDLDLSRYGIQHQDETLVVFNEVALAWLRRVAVPSDPDRPFEELSLGIDLASNVARFLAYIDENDVRFTVRGEIFKTTEKRILQHLIPNPGRELSREEVLSFIFRFGKEEGLVDRTGQRTFAVSFAGRSWPSRPLFEKQKALFEFALQDRRLEGEYFHQSRMRQIFLRLLKRVEPGVWYDLMYLPFLARNSYLAALDDLQVEEHFAERSQRGSFPAMEDPQRLVWNLAKWVRQRLYLLGVIDMGYDAAQRPVAMRLTPTGARLLGLDRIGPVAPRSVGSCVVTPDFEVVLFPTGDDAQLIHDLDLFCRRSAAGSVLHFRIEQDTVRRALKAGMALSDLLDVLEYHSRTPVPQNVTFSIRDWAARAGLMHLSEGLLLTCEEADVLRRFRQDPGARPYVGRAIDERTLQLKGRITPKRCQALLRELGYLVELAGKV